MLHGTHRPCLADGSWEVTTGVLVAGAGAGALAGGDDAEEPPLATGWVAGAPLSLPPGSTTGGRRLSGST